MGGTTIKFRHQFLHVIENHWQSGFQFAADLASIPQPGGAVGVQPGETWNFQAWFRDGTGLWDLSNGLNISFLP